MDELIDDISIDEPSTKQKRPGLPVEPRRILWILAEHRRSLTRVFLGACAVALVAFLLLPERYEASAQLLYEGIPVLEPDDESPSPSAFVHSATAASRVREVRERLGWDVPIEDLAGQVQVQLEAETSMRIVGEASSAERALALTQAVVDVFLEGQRRFNQQRLERLSEENELALQHAEQRLERALQAYEAFREKSGKPDLLQEREELIARANDARAQADEAAVEAAAQKARIAELEQAQRELPRQIISSAKRGTPVDTPLAKARAELAEARASLSEEHPRVKALKERVKSLEAQRGSERTELGEQTVVANPTRSSVEQQIASARAALAGAEERESALRVLATSLKQEIASLAPEEGEARQVIGELEVAEEHLEALKQRATGIRDASVRPPTGFRVLSAPMLPESSQRAIAGVVGVVALPILAVVVFALVLLARRLRSLTVEAPREVAWWGNGPVLGTSVWPRDPKALDSFVDELEDQGIYGAGRTLVVPATEAEREIACSFAMRLAQAPWLAAAILDVDDVLGKDAALSPLVTPSPGRHLTPPPMPRVRRLSSQATPSVTTGRVVTTPPPRPARKKTVIGLPAVQSSDAPPADSTPPSAEAQASPDSAAPPKAPSSDRPAPRNARATIRMVVPVGEHAPPAGEHVPREGGSEEEAFLLTRPVPVEAAYRPQTDRPGPAAAESRGANTSSAVMRAAVRLLGEGDDITEIRRSQPPITRRAGEVRGVALAWNGPLSGPVLRRAARLAHRVMVVVSSGMSGIDLTRIQTRLGRDKGVGYVLVNVPDAYVDLEDRVGPVEAFWQGANDGEPSDFPAR